MTEPSGYPNTAEAQCEGGRRVFDLGRPACESAVQRLGRTRVGGSVNGDGLSSGDTERVSALPGTSTSGARDEQRDGDISLAPLTDVCVINGVEPPRH